MKRHSVLVLAVIIAALATTEIQAQDQLYWEGSDGNFIDSNYTNFTDTLTDQPPGATDYIFLGLNSNLTLAESRGIGRLRVGFMVGPPDGPGVGTGPATLTVTGNGTELQINNGAAFPNAGIWVGNQQNGTLTIQDSAVVVVSRLVEVGAGNNNTATGTLNINTGARLTINEGNLNIGDRAAGANNGNKGVVNLDDSTSVIEIPGGQADMLLGVRQRTGMYTQTAGTVTIADSIEVGPDGGSSNGSIFTISGGSVSTGTLNTGNFWVGRGASTNAVVNISGTADVNVGNRFLMGGSADDAVFTATPQTNSSTTNHSGGTLDIDVDLRIADTSETATSTATYNLSGTGVINTNVVTPTDPATTSSIIGRRGIGRFFQTGGTANFNSPLEIGNRQATGASVAANGLYEISAGDLNVNAPSSSWPIGLSIAPNGTGEFRVVGDDATIDVTGNFAISTTADGNGTLAFELETGESLSQINVTGAATFNAGAILTFDTTNASPAATMYDVLTAASMTDNGLTFSGPSDWDFQIVDGGLGKVLQLIQSVDPSLPGDHNGDDVVDILDYVVWRMDPDGNGGDPDGYEEWAENYGNPPGSGSSQGQSSAVPEPATGGLSLLVGLMGWCGRAAVRRR